MKEMATRVSNCWHPNHRSFCRYITQAMHFIILSQRWPFSTRAFEHFMGLESGFGISTFPPQKGSIGFWTEISLILTFSAIPRLKSRLTKCKWRWKPECPGKPCLTPTCLKWAGSEPGSDKSKQSVAYITRHWPHLVLYCPVYFALREEYKIRSNIN